jgi:hypothetical protein
MTDFCSSCGGRLGNAVGGAASLRGARWAEKVVRELVERWPLRWPRSPKAVYKAGRWIEDLAGGNQQLREYLVDVCMRAAAKRYDELTGYLRGASLRLPPGPPPLDDDEWPK